MKVGGGILTRETHPIDEKILQILSLYDHLTPLQIWYELGEDDLVEEKLTEAEIFERLEFLRARGFLETVTKVQVGGRFGYLGYRVTPAVTSR